MNKLLIIFPLCLVLTGCDFRNCIKSHEEKRTQSAWVQWLPTGKTIIPIFHPQYDYTVTVCDEYEISNPNQE